VRTSNRSWQFVLMAGAFGVVVLAALAGITATPRTVHAGWPWKFAGCNHHRSDGSGCAGTDGAVGADGDGTWYWLRSPDQEKRVVSSLYNRYCIRCHGVDGRGVWDIPDVPDFTNVRWQGSRTDGQLVHITLEGRGAVMPPFRGTLTLEEAWGMARYLRTFVPGSEPARPDLGKPENPGNRPAEMAPLPREGLLLPPPGAPQ
jgi:hypothetical protein